jgi:hypothetical protein
VALDEEKVTVGGNRGGVRNFIASAGSVRWSDVDAVVREKFGHEVEGGVFKLGGRLETKGVRFDTGSTDDVFGVEWRGFEDQVESVVSAFLEVKREEERKRGAPWGLVEL